MNTNFAVDLGESILCRTIQKRGKIGLGFDPKMAGMGSREGMLKHLDLCVEEWQKRNPGFTPTEIDDHIFSGCSLVTGGVIYTGFRFFKPVKRKTAS